MTTSAVLAISCLVLLAVYETAGQETFDKQAEREKQFEDKTASEDAQAEENRRSPTGKFLLLKGEIRDDDDSRNDMSLLDKLMPSKTKVIIDGGAAFPFPPPPPPPPPPMLPPQFILPPPHAFIPSVIIGPSSDFSPLPLGPQQEQKPEEEAGIGASEQHSFFGADNAGEQQRPNFENMMRPSSNDGPMMPPQQQQQQEMASQRFQNMMADMQRQQQQTQQPEWSPGSFRMMQGNGDAQQESAQRFQGMLPLDVQQSEQAPSAQRFQGAPFESQQEQSQPPQRFQGMIASAMAMGENNNNNMQPSRFESQPESWTQQNFQASLGDMQPQQPQQQQQPQQDQGPQRFQGPEFTGVDMMAMMNGKMPQQPMGFFQFPQKENGMMGMPTGKSNKKNKDKKPSQKPGSGTQDMMPEPEPPGCSCGPMFNKSGWGHLKRCAKRCAAHHHHQQSEHQINARNIYWSFQG